ncbi:MAG: riboflavin synthase, partial [Candidatus Peregrinibacteria bacterium]|nr:riboflavin synthase [Candidatus Peregrinibacteria bacterium]
MFTGIIEATGKITKIEENLFTISHPFEKPFELGESIAISGMCTTVISSNKTSFTVEVMKESRNRTVFGSVQAGEKVNLERSAVIGSRNSGHFVLGHVDEVGEIISRKTVDDYELFRIKISPANSDLIVFKGSISVNGISLTISNLATDWFEISIISHTLEVTDLGDKRTGDMVNLEYDILGKYVLRKEEVK